MKKILVTGSDSGLGKFLKKKFSAKGFNRKSNFSKIQNVKWNLIIHCAFNPKEPYDKNSLTKLINDNLVLSYNVSKLKGIKIFISSCSVYEDLPIKKRTENSKIFINKKNSIILCPMIFIITQYLPLIPSGSFFTNFGAIIFWINVGLIYSEFLKYE